MERREQKKNDGYKRLWMLWKAKTDREKLKAKSGRENEKRKLTDREKLKAKSDRENEKSKTEWPWKVRANENVKT